MNSSAPNPRARRIVTIGVGLLAALLGVGFSVLLLGSVQGREFCPQTFTRRDYWYWQVPLIGLQVWPVQRQQVPHPLEQYLTRNKLISSASPPQRWDLIVSYRLGDRWREGDAFIWEQYCGARTDDGSEYYWLQWSKDHPTAAQALWPAVATVARDGLYLLMPDLFDLTQRVEDAAEFATEMNLLLADRYEQLAGIEWKLGNYQRADTYFSRALSYDPQRESCLVGRARCRQQAGQGGT